MRTKAYYEGVSAYKNGKYENNYELGTKANYDYFAGYGDADYLDYMKQQSYIGVKENNESKIIKSK